MKTKHKKYALLVYVILLINSSFSQSLDSLLQLSVKNNPELKALHLEYEAELDKVDQVSQLNNPEIGIGVPILRPETRLGPQVLMISASQMFPWFGTLKAKKDVVISMSKIRYERISILKLSLFNHIKIAYFQLIFLNDKKEVIHELLATYTILSNVTLAKVESGLSSTSDVLRIQLKLHELKQKLKLIENEKMIYYSKINELTNQNFDTKIKVSEDFSQLNLLDFNLADYKKQIEANHPMLAKLDFEMERSKRKQNLNNSLNKPTIGLGLDYSIVSNRTDATPQHNGQDIFIPKVKVSIPLYRKSYRAKISEESKHQESIEFQKTAFVNKMMMLLLKYKSNYDNANIKTELHNQQIEITKMTYDILLSKYSSTGKGFNELLQIQNELTNYKLELKIENLNIRIAKANIEMITI